jgi:hypothetical protein
MTDQIHRPEQDAPPPARSGLLPLALRRDLTDLNSQYLELGLAEGLEGDPRFGWSEPVRRCLLSAGADTRSGMAAVPFALFGLQLMPDGPAVAIPRVADAQAACAPVGWQGRYESFVHQSVFLARQLLDGEPMALNLVFGLPDEARRWLAESRLAELAAVAGSARVIRPRWRLHARFWDLLTLSARRGTPGALQWAHCIGLCLLGAADGEVASAPPRRRPRR